MAKKTTKYYVVWQGHKKGVYSSWAACKKQIDGYQGAQYKSFVDKATATTAFSKNYADYKGVSTKKKALTSQEKARYGKPLLESISVDAACSGNPGAMEYRGVLTHSKKEIFRKGPYKRGTNNIGEFLALVHGIALLKSKKMHQLPIYSDSRIAMGWVQKKQCKTKLVFTSDNKELLTLILRAEKWLKENTFTNPILKWETKAWGEIPADFGRK